MNKLKVMECFGGIGACTKALENLNIPHEIVDYVEIDKHAVDSYNAIHNTNFEPQDISEWNKDIEVDLIMHGSPCQDFSLAGKQEGGDFASGTRSSLMYETLRIVNKLKPKYVVWENVKNLLSKTHRHNFDNYLEYMSSIGYTNYYKVLNAKNYGIPQNRERVFTISIRNDIDTTFEFPEEQELTLKLKDMLEKEVDPFYYLSVDKISSIAHWKAYQKPFEKVYGKNSVAPTLTARGAGEEHSGMITYCEDLEDTTNLQEQCLHIKDNAYGEKERQLFTEDGNIRRYIDSDKIDIFEEGQMATTSYPTGYGHGPRTHNESISLNTIDKPSVKVDLNIRKLTPRESWRLMGFSDSDFDKASTVNGRTQLYKQAGNSIVVNVLMAIFKNLLGGYYE